jgi:Uroporphyrinogen decarboxylase (URO-D)
VNARTQWDALLRGNAFGPLLVDVGTSTLTGVRPTAVPQVDYKQLGVCHPAIPTIPLSASDCARLGSDFARAGLVFETPKLVEGEFRDLFGVGWLWAEGAPAPFHHPLQSARASQVSSFPRPRWPTRTQIVAQGETDRIVVADAPCPGLLELCFVLRGGWQFMDDITSNWRVASALLDWSLETVVAAYEHMLSRLPQAPDIVIYGDDYGFQGGMFLSDLDFRTFLRPRLRTLLSRLRRLSRSAICFHSCGAIRPIVPDLADLGIELLNLDPSARGMVIDQVRKQLPSDLILHGSVDLVALGRAIDEGNRASVALLVTEFATSGPAVAAPIDSLSNPDDIDAVARGAALLHSLCPEDIDTLREIGPVRSIIDQALQAAENCPVNPFVIGAPCSFAAGEVRAFDAAVTSISASAGSH